MSSHSNQIPPPPGPDAKPEELAAYFEQYDRDELEEAGYVTQLLPGDADYPEDGNGTDIIWQLNLIFTAEEMAQLQSYVKTVHVSLEILAKQWIFQRYQVEMVQDETK